MPGPALSVNSPFMQSAGCHSRKLGDLDAALDVALGVGHRLAVLAGEHVGELVHVAVDQRDEGGEHAGATLRIDGGPCRLGGLRHIDRRAHVVGGGERHARGNLARLGV